MDERYLKLIGELYLQYRISMEEMEQKLAQKDALIEHLKSENLQLKRGVAEHGTVGT
jgi:hypothetical protein